MSVNGIKLRNDQLIQTMKIFSLTVVYNEYGRSILAKYHKIDIGFKTENSVNSNFYILFYKNVNIDCEIVVI
jgi:hypothetical protein